MGFRVFYCPEFPVASINFNQTPRPERAAWRLSLAENIRTAGLKNPLIILNHPRPKCQDLWLMVGTNRLWAIRHLGWPSVPCVVTGWCPFPSVEIPDWDALRRFFKDGEPYRSAYGIALKNTIPPESGTYPSL